MARDLTVRVRADVGAYQKAMSAAAKSTDQFAQSGLRLQKMGLGISNLGDSLTRRVTLPLALAGAAAIKMASDFDASFVRMQTLAGVSAGEVDSLKESVLELAGETGRAPQELADALYFLQSSGLDSAQAMDALENSAKASAVGLGATEDVANAVSSAMLAYAESGLTAAEATDVLIATAREGKAEPAELAGQMGRLLPIASELGITFGDVGGAIAALSTKGNNAEQATTQLVNVMSKLLKPSQQSAKALEEVGLSSDSIRQMIAERGLLGTLEELRARLGESGFVKYFEDVQAVQGALSLLSGDLDKTRSIIDAVNGSAGATENAFSKWAESMGAQNAQAFAQFQVALIHIGEVLAPIASDVLDFVSKIAEAFSNLPGPVQTAIIAFAGIAAALGPVMSIGGRLITVYGTIARLLPELALPAGTIEGAFNGAASSTSKFSSALAGLGKATLVVGALVALREILMALEDDTRGIDVSALENELLDLADTGKFAGTNLKKVFSDLDLAADPQKLEAQADRLGKLDEALAQLAARDPKVAAAAFREISDALREQGASSEQIKQFFNDYAAAVANADTASRTAGDGLDETTAGMSEVAGATQDATSALQDYQDQLTAMTDPIFAAMDAINGVRDAQVGLKDAQAAVIEAQTALNEALASGDPAAVAEATRNLEGAQRGLADAQWATVTSAAEADAALAGLTDAVQNGDVNMATFKSTLAGWVAQGFLTQDQANKAAAAVKGLGDKAAEADKKRVDVPVTTPGVDRAQDELNQTQRAVAGIPASKTIRVTSIDAATGTIRYIQSRVDALTGKTITITTRLVSYSVPSYQTFGGGQAAGGPVSASKWYIVGEKGPEAFVPDRNGYIVPNHAMGNLGTWGGGGGGAATIVNVTVHGSVIAERELVSTINRQLSRGAINKNGRAL